MKDGFISLQKTYLNEIADNYRDIPDVRRRLDSLCELLLGEKIPAKFVSKVTGEEIVKPYQKLTKAVLNDLVIRWMTRQKFDLVPVDEFEKDKNLFRHFLQRFLSAIEPDYIWQ